MNDKDEDRCCPSHERRKLLTCSSSTACARTVGHQFSHVGSTLTTFVRRFSLAFFFFVYFSAYSLSVSLSPQPAALPIEATSILAGVLFVSTQEEEEAKKKKTIGDARLLAVSPQACSLFTGCTKFARIYIDAT